MNFSKLSCIIGNKSTGKTTYCKAAIKAYMSSGKDRKVVIIDTYLSPSYNEYAEIKLYQLLLLQSGIVRIVVPAFEIDTILAFIIDNEINNIFIIIEDSGKYFDNTVSDTQKIYLRDVKNKGRETLLVYHFFNDIPTRLFKLCDRLILKKTADTLKSVRERTTRPDVIEAYNEVLAHTNPYFSKVIELT